MASKCACFYAYSALTSQLLYKHSSLVCRNCIYGLHIVIYSPDLCRTHLVPVGQPVLLSSSLLLLLLLSLGTALDCFIFLPQELLEFDFGAIERRLEELSRKNKTGKYPLPSFSPPKGLGPDFSPSASAAASVADAFNKYDELDTEDLPSLSSWLADTESTLRDPDWGASLGPTDVPLMNGLPPPSVLQAQLRELTSQASVIPSRLDQLKLRKVPTASSPESPSTVQSKNSPDAVPEVLPAAAAATGTASNEKEEADALLVELMEPAQRQPYREFKRDMEERAKAREAARLRGIHTTLPDLAPGAVPSLEAARNALETFQKERMATVGSVSEPLARAQAQLAELEVSLAKDRQQPLPWAELEASLRERNSPPTRDSAARITDAAKPHLEAARRSREARKAAWAAYKEKDSLLPEDFKRRMDEVYNPSEEHTAAVAAAVKLGVEDFKSGRVANRSEAVRARVSEVYKRRDPLLQFPKDRGKTVILPAIALLQVNIACTPFYCTWSTPCT